MSSERDIDQKGMTDHHSHTQKKAQDMKIGDEHHFERTRAPGQTEIGFANAATNHVAQPVAAQSGLVHSIGRQKWERIKPTWLMELIAEAMGVFLYTYCGGLSIATMVLTAGKAGSILQVGFAYALGIALAVLTCSITSGGHFNPCITIAQVIFKGFPIRKAPLYIIAQIFGAFVAAMFIFVQYEGEMRTLEGAMKAGGNSAMIFTSNGPAGALALFPTPGRSKGSIFLNEFIVDFVLAVVIWSVLDPTNPFVSPASAPFVVGSAYAVAIWGAAFGNLSTNLARDFGTRLASAALFGKGSWSPGWYCAVAALTSIPATLLAAFFYGLFLSDSRNMPASQAIAALDQEARDHHMRSRDVHGQLASRETSRIP